MMKTLLDFLTQTFALADSPPAVPPEPPRPVAVWVGRTLPCSMDLEYILTTSRDLDL